MSNRSQDLTGKPVLPLERDIVVGGCIGTWRKEFIVHNVQHEDNNIKKTVILSILTN